jgi:molybdopterin-guanine dinucleotide biosynthesis protein A
MEHGISAAILAGGMATRLGGIVKSMVPINGIPVIDRILKTLEGIFTEIVIITNSQDEFSKYENRIVPDVYEGIGPLGGIHAALNSSSSDTVFIVAGDMPLLDRELIIQQVMHYMVHQPDVLIPKIGSYIEPLHSIVSINVLEDLESYIINEKNKAVWKFLSTVDVEYYKPADETAAANSFKSCNTPEDKFLIERILNQRK